MSQPPYEQQQARQAEQQRAKQAEQQRTQEAEQRREREAQKSRSSDQTQTVQPETIIPSEVKRQTKKSPGLKSEPLKVTAGRAGERNIAITWVANTRVDGSPWYAFAMTAGFEVKTVPGNDLEVSMEQLQYRKTHVGSGRLRTSLIPVAPIGTKGKVIARDMTTGEIAEQPWIWFLLGGGGGFSLWKAIKRLFWKAD